MFKHLFGKLDEKVDAALCSEHVKATETRLARVEKKTDDLTDKVDKSVELLGRIDERTLILYNKANGGST